MPTLPLHNVRVLEIAEGVAGPWGSSLLGDLGAQCIKIEAIQRMDQTRGQTKPKAGTHYYPKGEPGARPWNLNVSFVRANRNKMGLTLDLSRAKGLELFKDLVRLSDVVLTNMVTGVPEKMGIDYQRLKKIRPDIIMLTSCGYGHSGPYAKNVAMAGSMDPVSGHTWLRGYENEDPLSTSYSAHTDSVNATNSAFGIMMALHHRALTGQGQHIDVSGVEAMMTHLGEALVDYTLNGRERISIGNRHPYFGAHNVYQVRGEDRWVGVALRNENDWQNFRRAIGEPAWTSDVRFKSVLARWSNREALDKYIEEWTSQRTGYEVMEVLQKAKVPASPVLHNKDVFSDPHIQQSRFFQRAHHNDLGDFDFSGLAWHMSKTQGGVRLPPPGLGEHNEFVYKELMGVDGAAYEGLLNEGYAGTTPIDKLV